MSFTIHSLKESQEVANRLATEFISKNNHEDRVISNDSLIKLGIEDYRNHFIGAQYNGKLNGLVIFAEYLINKIHLKDNIIKEMESFNFNPELKESEDIRKIAYVRKIDSILRGQGSVTEILNELKKRYDMIFLTALSNKNTPQLCQFYKNNTFSPYRTEEKRELVWRNPNLYFKKQQLPTTLN